MHRFSPLIFSCLLIASPAMAQDALVAASTRYAHPALLQQLFIGGNYRATWSRPASVKIFRIDTAQGGFTIKKLGGGMQTKSLRIESKSGEKYVLRTVDKTVSKALEAEGIRNPVARHVAQDMISAADPYAAVTVPPMARALGVISVDAIAVLVADNPALGKYRPIFANTVCLLEQQNPLKYQGDETVNTKEMLETMKKEPASHHLDEKMLLQARLLDMLIGDWDRHSDQWKWELHKVANGTIIYPVPHDHDQAYFNSNGLLINMVRPFALKHMVGYRPRHMRLIRLNRKEWSFDKVLLAHLSEQDWHSGLQTFHDQLTDAVLADAVHQLPPEIFATRGEELITLLKSRRDALQQEAVRYYRFLQQHKAGPVLRKHGTDD